MLIRATIFKILFSHIHSNEQIQQNLEYLAASLKQAFMEVDSQMRDTFNRKSSPNERSGCTAIAVVVTPTHIVTANAGDSRACLSRGGRNVVSPPPASHPSFITPHPLHHHW